MNAQSVPYPFLKRATDMVLTGLLLALLAPVFVFVSGAIGLDLLLSRRDRGSWLYRERRISRAASSTSQVPGPAAGDARACGRPFRLWEDDAENLTWAGRRILKPWYLDELPPVKEQVATGFDYRNRAIAGWTGPAQVRKGLVETAYCTELDLAYLEACRTWPSAQLVRYDLVLPWKTVRLMVRGEGLQF